MAYRIILNPAANKSPQRYNLNSDLRLKKNILSIQSVLDFVSSVFVNSQICERILNSGIFLHMLPCILGTVFVNLDFVNFRYCKRINYSTCLHLQQSYAPFLWTFISINGFKWNHRNLLEFGRWSWKFWIGENSSEWNIIKYIDKIKLFALKKKDEKS